VVPASPPKWYPPPPPLTVIDGYKRIAALEQLGRDTVEAVVWPMSEAAAVVLDRSLRLCLPAKIVDQPGQVEWKLPLYNAFGKTGVQIKVVGGRARKASGRRKPREEWMVLSIRPDRME